MNKQELIERYQNFENILDDIGARVACKHFLKDLEQLDEPEKVKVPQFVAEWIEKYKRELSIREAMSQAHVSIEVDDWLMELDEDGAFLNQDTFALAWIFGYEVEEEKRYLVKIKASNQYIMKNPDENAIFFYSSRAYSRLTRKELEEAGYGWVFDCPGIEIEEVE